MRDERTIEMLVCKEVFMSQENLRQISNQLRTSNDKYTYFLLAVSASVIALSIKLTTDSVFTLHLLMLGIANMLWASSFYCGCKKIETINKLIALNGDYLYLKYINGDQVNIPKEMKDEMDEIPKSMGINQGKSAKYGYYQFNLLLWGVLAFVLWHMLKMAFRTFAN